MAGQASDKLFLSKLMANNVVSAEKFAFYLTTGSTSYIDIGAFD